MIDRPALRRLSEPRFIIIGNVEEKLAKGVRDLLDENDRLREACGLVVAAFERDDSIDFGHYPYEVSTVDGPIEERECPEDDTCECLGPKAINACAAAIR